MTAQTTELVRTTNGVERSRRLMDVLAPEEATTLARVDAFAMVDAADEDAMVAWMIERAVGWGELGPVVTVEGRVKGYHASESHAREILEDERGVPVSSEAVFFEPYLKGREAALTAMAGRLEGSPAGRAFRYGAFLLFGLAALKLWIGSRRRRPAWPAAATEPMPAEGHRALMAAPAEPPKPLSEMTPRERVVWKAQRRAAT